MIASVSLLLESAYSENEDTIHPLLAHALVFLAWILVKHHTSHGSFASRIMKFKQLSNDGTLQPVRLLTRARQIAEEIDNSEINVYINLVLSACYLHGDGFVLQRNMERAITLLQEALSEHTDQHNKAKYCSDLSHGRLLHLFP